MAGILELVLGSGALVGAAVLVVKFSSVRFMGLWYGGTLITRLALDAHLTYPLVPWVPVLFAVSVVGLAAALWATIEVWRRHVLRGTWPVLGTDRQRIGLGVFVVPGMMLGMGLGPMPHVAAIDWIASALPMVAWQPIFWAVGTVMREKRRIRHSQASS
jgi:hypothetical protein